MMNMYFLCSKIKKNTEFGIRDTLPLSSPVNLGKLGYQASIFSSTELPPPAPEGGSD